MTSELAKGITHEREEHEKTLEKLAEGEITVPEATEQISQEHITEDPHYYEHLEAIEDQINQHIDGKPEKQDQTNVGYNNPSTLQNEHCGNCGWYRNDICYIVKGIISEKAWCRLWGTKKFAYEMDNEENRKNEHMKLKDTHKIFIGQQVYYKPKDLKLTIESWDHEYVKLKHVPIFVDDEIKVRTWSWDDIIDKFWADEITVEGFEPEEKYEFTFVIERIMNSIRMQNKDKELETVRSEHELLKSQLKAIEDEKERIKLAEEAEQERVRLANEAESIRLAQIELEKKQKQERIDGLQANIEIMEENLVSLRGKKREEMKAAIEIAKENINELM